MSKVAASRIISGLLFGLVSILVVGLALAPRLEAFEAFDGRLQAHGFFESQLRVLNEDFAQEWDVVQWYNVFNLEIEADFIQDTWGPIDLLSAYVRAEVRYDCVYSRGCGMFRSVNAYGDRSKSLPRRLHGMDEMRVAGEFVIENEGPFAGGDRDPLPLSELAGFTRIADTDGQELLDRNGDQVLDQYEATVDMTLDFSEDGIRPWDYTFGDLLDDRFAMKPSIGGSNGGYPIQFMGPWLPKNFFDTRAVMADRVNPFDSSRVNPVVFNPFPFQEYALWDSDDPSQPNPDRPMHDPLWGQGRQSAEGQDVVACRWLWSADACAQAQLPDDPELNPDRSPLSFPPYLLNDDATQSNLWGGAGCFFGSARKGCHGGPGEGANPFRPIPIYAEDRSAAGAEWNHGDARFNTGPYDPEGVTIPYKLTDYGEARLEEFLLDPAGPRGEAIWQALGRMEGVVVVDEQKMRTRISSDITKGDYQVNVADNYGYQVDKNPATATDTWLGVKGEGAQNAWDARGLFLPSPPLVKWMQSGDFDTFEFNFRQAERAWNRGASQQDTKELKEAYLDAEFLDSRLWIRAGLQQIVWGKTELFRTTDQFNPVDLALASLPSLEEARIGQWAVRAVYSLYEVGPLEDVRVELAFNMDDYEPNDLGACGEAFTPNLVCSLTMGGYAHGFTGLGVAGVDRPPSPWESLEGWEIGGRIEFRWDRFSFAISDFYGYDDFPYVERISTYQRNVDPYTGLPLVYDDRSPEERRAELAEPVYFRDQDQADRYAAAHGGVPAGQPAVMAGDLNPWRKGGCAVGGRGGDPMAARTPGNAGAGGAIAVRLPNRRESVSLLTGDCLTPGPTDLRVGVNKQDNRSVAVQPDPLDPGDPGFDPGYIRSLGEYISYEDRHRWRTNYVARDANGKLIFPDDCEATNSCYPMVEHYSGRVNADGTLPLGYSDDECEIVNGLLQCYHGRPANALNSHHANQSVFAWVCSSTVGFLPDVDRRSCAMTAFGSSAEISGITMGMIIGNLIAGKPYMNALLTEDNESEITGYIPPGQDPFRPGAVYGSRFIPFALPMVTLHKGPADSHAEGQSDPIASLGCTDPNNGGDCGETDTAEFEVVDKFLSDRLSPEQEALLGCGPFWGTNCENSGIDLLNADASVLLQSFAGTDGTLESVRRKGEEGIGAEGTYVDWGDRGGPSGDWWAPDDYRTDEGLQPGTLPWEVAAVGGPVCTTADIGGPLWSVLEQDGHNLPGKNVQLPGCRRKWLDAERTIKVEEEIAFRTNRVERIGQPPWPAGIDLGFWDDKQRLVDQWGGLLPNLDQGQCGPGDTVLSDLASSTATPVSAAGFCQVRAGDPRYLDPDQHHPDDYYSAYDGDPDWLPTTNGESADFPDAVYSHNVSDVMQGGKPRPSYWSASRNAFLSCDVGETIVADRPLPAHCYAGHPFASSKETGVVVPFASEMAGLSWNFQMLVTAFSSELLEGLQTVGDLADPSAVYAYPYREADPDDRMLGGSNPDMTPDYDGDGEVYNLAGPNYQGPSSTAPNNDTYYLDDWYKDSQGRPIPARCQDPSGRPDGVLLPGQGTGKTAASWFHCNKDSDDRVMAQIYQRRRYAAQLLFAYCGSEYGTGECSITDVYNQYSLQVGSTKNGIEALRTLLSGKVLTNPTHPAHVAVDPRAKCMKHGGSLLSGLPADYQYYTCENLTPGNYLVADGEKYPDPDSPVENPYAKPTTPGGDVLEGIASDPAADLAAYVADEELRGEYWNSLQFVTTRSDCSPDNPEQEGCVWARSSEEDDQFEFLQNVPGEEDDAYLITSQHCSMITPQYCGLVESMFNVAGVKRDTLRAGGNGSYGRRTFQWHSGGEVVLRYDKRNVLGFAMDFTEDRTKTNFGVEFTWIGGVPNMDNNEWDNISNTDDFNLTVSVDRPTFINFLNANRTFFFNSQWFFQYRNGYNESFPGNGPWNVLATFTAMTGYFQDRLQPALTFVHDFQSVSGALLPSVSYRFDENFSATVGALFFYGRSQWVDMPVNEIGPASNRVGSRAYQDGADNGLALVRDRDELFLRLRYTF
jgi:hypothetical protein